MPNHLTDTEHQTIRDGHAAGRSCSAIAKELGRATSTVSRWAAAQGLTWSTTQTEAATKVKTASNREKRATLEGRLLDEAALLLDQLHQPHRVYNFGGSENIYEERMHDEPDVGAKKALVQAASTAIDRAMKIAAVDAAQGNSELGRSMIGSLFAALHVTPVHDDTEQSEQPAETGGSEAA